MASNACCPNNFYRKDDFSDCIPVPEPGNDTMVIGIVTSVFVVLTITIVCYFFCCYRRKVLKRANVCCNCEDISGCCTFLSCSDSRSSDAMKVTKSNSQPDVSYVSVPLQETPLPRKQPLARISGPEHSRPDFQPKYTKPDLRQSPSQPSEDIDMERVPLQSRDYDQTIQADITPLPPPYLEREENQGSPKTAPKQPMKKPETSQPQPLITPLQSLAKPIPSNNPSVNPQFTPKPPVNDAGVDTLDNSVNPQKQPLKRVAKPHNPPSLAKLNRDINKAKAVNHKPGHSKTPVKTTLSNGLTNQKNHDFYVSGIFNHNGGHLVLPHLDIKMHIPAGAINMDEEQEIYMYLNLDPKKEPPLRPGESLVSPVVVCGPEGLTFNQSVVLSYPHCISDPAKSEVTTLYTGEVEAPQPVYSDLKDDKKSLNLIRGKKMVLFMDHFTGFTSVAVGGVKKMAIMHFTSPLVPGDDLLLRYWIFNRDRATRQAVLHEERELGGVMCTAAKDIRVNADAGDIELTVDKLMPGWTPYPQDHYGDLIDFNSVWTNNKSYIEFHFEPSDESKDKFRCIVRTNQISSAAKPTVSTIFMSDTKNIPTQDKPIETEAVARLRESILPYEVRIKICRLMDHKQDTGIDWRVLTDEMNLTMDDINLLEQNSAYHSPTFQLLSLWELEKSPEPSIQSLTSLMNIFQKCGRVDAARIIHEHIEETMPQGVQGVDDPSLPLYPLPTEHEQMNDYYSNKGHLYEHARVDKEGNDMNRGRTKQRALSAPAHPNASEKQKTKHRPQSNPGRSHEDLEPQPFMRTPTRYTVPHASSDYKGHRVQGVNNAGEVLSPPISPTSPSNNYYVPNIPVSPKDKQPVSPTDNQRQTDINANNGQCRTPMMRQYHNEAIANPNSRGYGRPDFGGRSPRTTPPPVSGYPPKHRDSGHHSDIDNNRDSATMPGISEKPRLVSTQESKDSGTDSPNNMQDSIEYTRHPNDNSGRFKFPTNRNSITTVV
ncbi:unnamed protein product [Owenia fusiformis]|uniref:Netrin receptor UNC5 n=1 Tax=Owenia fusiformis TaxID=6347 RepID=A0A8S4NXQ5_OWEFU|nr:unnamed protein product [Owenia fusiformis]